MTHKKTKLTVFSPFYLQKFLDRREKGRNSKYFYILPVQKTQLVVVGRVRVCPLLQFGKHFWFLKLGGGEERCYWHLERKTRIAGKHPGMLKTDPLTEVITWPQMSAPLRLKNLAVLKIILYFFPFKKGNNSIKIKIP